MAGKVMGPWQPDVVGNKDPQLMRGKKFLHVKTATLYVVTGYSFNATTDQWAIHYDRHDQDERAPFSFTRDMSNFMDGRFIPVT